MTITTSLLAVLDDLLGALTTAPMPPPVPSDPSTPSAKATAAHAAMLTDKSDPARITGIRKRYETAYGFTHGLRIQKPWIDITVGDLDAVIAVADTLAVRAPQVLALWIQEGKIAQSKLLHGGARHLTATFTADVSRAQIRAWLRSWLFFEVFGSDAYTSVTEHEGADSTLNDADAGHDGRFDSGFARLQELKLPGPAQGAAAETRTYLTSPQGALTAHLQDAAGKALGAKLPKGDLVDVTLSIRPTSVATWLYMQHALFLVYQSRMEALFIQEYGPPMHLDAVPWVTYQGWNGRWKDEANHDKACSPTAMPVEKLGSCTSVQYRGYFRGRPIGELPEDRIQQWYGDPPAIKLSPDELKLYYGTGTCARCNAVQFKYLVEAVSPWFE
jgi:hypothetical protein